MKQKFFVVALTLFMLIVPACSSAEIALRATAPPTQPVSQLQYYPLDTTTNIPQLDLQVTDWKIVRFDYIFGFPESNQLLPLGVTDFVLAPLSK